MDNLNASKEFFEFASSREHYTAEACMLWCFDARFSDLYDAFLDQRGFSKSKIDLIKSAGGAQALAGEAGMARDFIQDQIAKSIKLHHTDRLILMVHIDCGGYGGSKAFNDDHQVEWDHHASELKKASDFVKVTFPEIIQIESLIADFDGLHKMN